ncbi:hypothetical protein D3C75_922700 [compost metagenome]
MNWLRAVLTTRLLYRIARALGSAAAPNDHRVWREVCLIKQSTRSADQYFSQDTLTYLLYLLRGQVWVLRLNYFW